MRQTTAIMIGLFTLSMVVAGVAAHVGTDANNGALPAAEPATPDVSDASETAATYLYGPNLQPLAEQTGSGQQTLNIFGPDNRIVAQSVVDADGGVQRVRHLNADHAGSTRVVLDRAGDSVAAFHYTPFGATVASGEQAAEVRYRYTGHPANEGLFTYHAPVREYDPGSSSGEPVIIYKNEVGALTSGGIQKVDRIARRIDVRAGVGSQRIQAREPPCCRVVLPSRKVVCVQVKIALLPDVTILRRSSTGSASVGCVVITDQRVPCLIQHDSSRVQMVDQSVAGFSSVAPLAHHDLCQHMIAWAVKIKGLLSLCRLLQQWAQPAAVDGPGRLGGGCLHPGNGVRRRASRVAPTHQRHHHQQAQRHRQIDFHRSDSQSGSLYRILLAP